MYPGCDLPEQDYLPDRPAPLSSLDDLHTLPSGSQASGWPAPGPSGPAAGRFQETPSVETCSRRGRSLTG